MRTFRDQALVELSKVRQKPLLDELPDNRLSQPVNQMNRPSVSHSGRQLKVVSHGSSDPRRDGGSVHIGGGLSAAARKARRKFLRFFPGGFYDQKFIDWERGYKWAAHQAWDRVLNQEEYRRLLRGHEFQEIADLAVAIEARTHLLFSYDKMALRDAVRTLSRSARSQYRTFLARPKQHIYLKPKVTRAAAIGIRVRF